MRMRKLILLPILATLAAGAQAVRYPMNGKFGIEHALNLKDNTTRLDSIKVLGEWGGWVDSSAFYKYDKQNRVVEGTGYNGVGMKVSEFKVTYGADGSFRLVEWTSNDGKNCANVYTYDFNSKKQITSFSDENCYEKKTTHTTITYKNKKKQEQIECKSHDGGENSITMRSRDGKVNSITYQDRQIVYEYNQKGDLSAVVEKKNGMSRYIRQQKYGYDANGVIVSLTKYTVDGANTNQEDLHYEFNNEGNVIRTYRGKDYTDFTYDNKGRVIMETRIENGNIYGAKNKTYFYQKTPIITPYKAPHDLSRYPAGSPVAKYGKLQVKNGLLSDKEGRPVQLRGMSTHGVQWFTSIYTDPGAIDALVDNWNINVLRIAMYVQENGYATGDVKTSDEWNTYIDSVSSLCARKGIYCIIDWHILTPGDPLALVNYNKAIQFWNYMSKKHAGEAHVLYEICNEPNGGDVSWPRVREYARKIVETIRQNDKSSIVLVGTPVWSQDIDIAALAQIEDPDVMYTLHFYAGTHGKAFRQRGDRAMAAPYKTPIFITEFGTSDASGDNGFFKESTIEWLKWANDHNLSWCNWSFANKGESASALQKDADKKNWNAVTESGDLIRCVLRDPSLKSVQSCLGALENKKND